MTTKIELVGKDLVRITDGIFTTLRCAKCGHNLPLFTWECPHCSQKLTAENVEAKPKIYLTCFPFNWDKHNDVHGQALAEDGTGLAGHLSSNETWAKHDMGLTSDWKHDTYNEHYPQGYELVWIDDPSTDSRWQAALALNKAKNERGDNEINS